jgi:hypothetical protein
MCRNWERTGTCPRGGRCHFAHGEEEARPAGAAAAAAPGPATRVLQLERLLREAEDSSRQAQRVAADREAALLWRAEEAEARAADLERQLARGRLEAGAGDAGALSRALSGEASTASFAELAGGTDGFAASRILGRGGFGAVYRGEWGGRAVAVKRLDHVRQPPFLFGR